MRIAGLVDSEGMLRIFPAVLTVVLLAQSTNPPAKVDYRQIGNAPAFGKGIVIEKRQAGDVVHVQDVANLGVIVVPVLPVTIAPGPCVYTEGKLTFREGTHFKSATVLQTPDTLYFCVPDGTGKGFRWMRVRGETSW